MADTTNYFFNLPTVGGSSGSWGGSLNENWTKLDNLLYGASYTDGDSNTVEKIRPDLLGGPPLSRTTPLGRPVVPEV